MTDYRTQSISNLVQVRVLCQLDNCDSACFSGEVTAPDVEGGLFTTGDLVAGFGHVSGIVAVPPVDLLRVPSNVGPEGAAMLPSLLLGIRAARLARLRRGERTLLIGKGPVARLMQVALEANGASVRISLEPTSALTLYVATVAVDTTGDPAIIDRLFQNMPKMARIVLAGRGNGRTADFDLYRTVHRQGLEVIGLGSSPERVCHEDLAAAENLLRTQGTTLDSALSGCLHRLQH